MTEASIDFKSVYSQLMATDPDTYADLATESSAPLPIYDEDGSQSFFADGAYHCIFDSPNTYRFDLLSDPSLEDFALQIEVSALAGNGGGLVFRAQGEHHSGYRLLYGRPHIDLVYDRSSLFCTHKNVAPLNTYAQLTVIAEGDDLLVYIDGELLVHRRDDFSRRGAFGLLVVNFAGYDPTHVAFRNLRIWDPLPFHLRGAREEVAEASDSQSSLQTNPVASGDSERPAWSAVTLAQTLLTRQIVEELSMTLSRERAEKDRLSTELFAARQRIDELTSLNHDLQLQLQRVPTSDISAQASNNQSAPSSPLRVIDSFRQVEYWFDEETFDDTDLVYDERQEVRAFLIHAGNIVDGIQAHYGAGELPLAPAHGNVGEHDTKIVLDPDDAWSEISGCRGEWFGGDYVVQLTFHTRSGKIYGPFGDMAYAENIQPFSLAIQPDEHILALCGVTSFGDNGKNRHLGALGLILHKE